MSGLYQCPECKQFHTLSEEFDRAMLQHDKETSFVAKVQCKCGYISISGADISFNPETGEKEFWCFGYPYDKKVIAYNNLDIYPAIMLIECIEEESIVSTYHDGKVIYLKPEV